MSIQQLREARNEVAKQMRHLNDEHKSSWSNDLQQQFDQLGDKMTQLDQQIANEQRVLDAMGDRFDDVPKIKDAQNTNAVTENAVFRAWAMGGVQNLTPEQAQAYRNTMSTGVGSEGGYTVKKEVATSILERLKAFGAMRQVASRIVTQSGNAIDYPTTDGTNEEGELVPENQTATAGDISFGTLGLGVQKFSSKVIAVPYELLQDSQIDIEALINKRLRERIGRSQNSYFTNGTGVSQPKGLITAAAVGKVGAAGKIVTYDDLVDLQESVDDAYRIDGMSWMMTQQLRAEVRKMKDANGRPIWMPSYDAGIGAPQDELLLGERLVINNHMAKPGLNAKTLAYGAMGKYLIRDVMEISLFRFADSAFTMKGQVGFLAWARAGGNLMDIGGAVKVYQQAAS